MEGYRLDGWSSPFCNGIWKFFYCQYGRNPSRSAISLQLTAANQAIYCWVQKINDIFVLRSYSSTKKLARGASFYFI